MSQPVVMFLHGLESGPNGYKIRELSRTAESAGWLVMAPDCSGVSDPQARVRMVWSQWPHDAPAVVLVGSSLGGYVAAALAEQQQPTNLKHLLLLCPAFDLVGYPLKRPAQALPASQITLVHGLHDTVVPVQHSQCAAEAWQAELLLVDDDHLLHASMAPISHALQRLLRQHKPCTEGDKPHTATNL